MKHIITCSIFIAISMFSISAYSAGTGVAEIKYITVGASGIIFIETIETHINPASCSETKYAIGTDITGARHMYMLALTSRISGLPLSLTIDNNSCVVVGNRGFPRIVTMATR